MRPHHWESSCLLGRLHPVVERGKTGQLAHSRTLTVVSVAAVAPAGCRAIGVESERSSPVEEERDCDTPLA